MKVHGGGKFIASAALCLWLTGCAQTGPPLPPSLELAKPPADLRASRKGNRVTLSWSEPLLTTDRRSVRYLGPTLVCRSLDPDITACPSPAAMLPAPLPVAQNSKSSHGKQQKSDSSQAATQTYTDTLSAALQQQDLSSEITYAVEVLNRNARGAGLSNRVHVPAVVTLPPPGNLAAELNDDGVVLTWAGTGESQTTASLFNNAPVQFRYRIYRRDERSGKDAIAGEVPLEEPGPTHFTDSSLEWEGAYLYRITVVSIIKRPDSEIQVEGDDTPAVRVVAHDVFPPSVPAGLQTAYSGEGQKAFIDLIWAPVTNADLAGYNVYRSETNGAAVGQPVQLNSALVKSPSYRDSAVAPGKTYTYAVSAVDVRGNESQRSETSSESVP
jgi:hypothetical protein